MNQEALIPPANEEAEQAILATLMTDAGEYSNVVGILEGKSFYWKRHEVIFDAITELSKHGKPTDFIAVKKQLDESNIHEDIYGGKGYLLDLDQGMPQPFNTKYYATIVYDMKKRRKIIEVCHNVSKKAYDTAEKNVATQALTEFINLEHNPKDSLRHIKNITPSALREVEGAIMDDYTSGFKSFRGDDFDALSGRFRPGQVILIAAESSAGKSAFAQEQALRWAKKGIHVGFASQEMVGEEITHRWWSMLAHTEHDLDLPYMSLDVGGPKAKKHMDILKDTIAPKLLEFPLFVLDNKGGIQLSVTYIRTKFSQLKAKYPDKQWAFFVDYAQILPPDKSSSNREQQVAEISRNLKAMASMLNAPVIVLSQLNKDKSYRDKGGRPTQHAIRESAALFNDAHKVFFIWHPEGEKTVDSDGVETITETNEVHVIAGKSRQGKKGLAILYGRPEYGVFLNEHESQTIPYVTHDLPF